MAHELDMTTGKAAIAYVGERPWHGLGTQLQKGASIETWAKAARMDFTIKSAPVQFTIPVENSKKSILLDDQDNRQVLYRNDTNTSLSVVSSSYKIVQPKEILEFFRNLVADNGMELETAGSLFGGRRYWALANTNMEDDVIKNDRVKGMLLLTTSCDGTLATTAKFTSVRVVCNNTLRISMNEENEAVRVSHSSEFNPNHIQAKLGLLNNSWNLFLNDIKAMSKQKLSDSDAKKFFASLVLNPDQIEQFKNEEILHGRVQSKLDTMCQMYNGNSMGSNIAGKTVWGALNVVTEYADHHIGRIDDNRLWNSWFGYSENLKNKALVKARELV